MHFAFWNASYPKTHLIQSLNSLDSFRQNERLLENQRAGGSKELFLPKIDFKTCSAVNFPKKHPDFGGQETNQRNEIYT